MTAKERILRTIQALPDDASLEDAIEELHRLRWVGRAHHAVEGEVQEARKVPPASPNASAWDLLQRLTGSLSAPSDWASEHDHYLYGTPKRSGTA